MGETRPQVTYSPDGVLSIVPEFDDDEHIADRQLERLEELEDRWSATVIDTFDCKIVSVNIELATALGKFDFPPDKHRELSDFVKTINSLLPYYPEDEVDRVFGLEMFTSVGATGVIYPHFQRWLDAKGLDESTARSAIEAMATPFGEENVRKARKDFSYYGQGAHAFTFGIGLQGGSSSEFRFYEERESGQNITSRSGEINWKWVDLSTLGNCACWGVNGMDRDRLLFHGPSLRLYEMKPHNVDIPHQSLSLVLGMGSLAYMASQYKGQEDVFANATIRNIQTRPTSPETL